MELLYAFAGLSLACGAALTLLPEGGLRKTCSLALGLMMTLMWVSGLGGYLRLPEKTDAPDSVLTETSVGGASSDAARASWERTLSGIASRAGGVSAQVTLDKSGEVTSVLVPTDATDAACDAACAAVGAARSCVTREPPGDAR